MNERNAQIWAAVYAAQFVYEYNRLMRVDTCADRACSVANKAIQALLEHEQERDRIVKG